MSQQEANKACDNNTAGANVVATCGRYTSKDQLLIVGDGNFSFSLALAKRLGTGQLMCCTSYDSKEELLEKYPECGDILPKLAALGAKVLHSVDATALQATLPIGTALFDKAIFQFPLIHPVGKEQYHEKQPNMIVSNRLLVRAFLRSVAPLIKPLGEVHVSSKTLHPYNLWDISTLAADVPALRYTETIDFDPALFPGYFSRNVSRGSSFPLTACKTFIFVTASSQQGHENKPGEEEGVEPPRKKIKLHHNAADEEEKKGDGRVFNYGCNVCHKVMTGEKDYNQHMASKAHKFKLRLEQNWKKALEEEKKGDGA